MSAPVRAATFVVTSTADIPGEACGTECTLRQAITVADKDTDFDRIVFDPTVFASKQTIVIADELPLIRNLSIEGPNTPGAGLTIRCASHQTRTIFQTDGGSLVLSNLHLAGGDFVIMVVQGDLMLANCTISDSNWGIANWSLQDGSCSEEQQRLHPNLTFAELLEVSSMTAINCTFSGNYFGVYNDTGPVTLNSCTISGNEIGVEAHNGFLTLCNCLVVDNKKANIFNPWKTCQVSQDSYSITTGTAAAVGLDPNGLQDNDGATPTIALLPGSAARGVGAATFPVDQRGVSRSRPGGSDVGAYQTLGNSPKPKS